MHIDKLEIKTPFEEEDSLYLQALKRSLSKILPPGFFPDDLKANPSEVLDNWNSLLPLIEWTPLKKPPFYLSFFLCCQSRHNVFRFFQEMLCRWLIPGRGLNPTLQFAIDFYLPQISQTQYIAGSVVIPIESKKDLDIVLKNLPILETEIRLGVQSSYQANRILEIKGLTTDEKTGMIQENIAMLVKYRPQDFDYDIFSEMQHFLVFCKEEFKHMRASKHMSRIICFFYLFRKALLYSSEAFPDRRFVSVKLLRVTLSYPFNVKKRVLGIIVGLSFLSENEIFTQSHILKAVKSFIPHAKLVKGSFFKNASRYDPTCLVYVEVEKEDEMAFTFDETSLLKEGLPNSISECIEKSYNPIFMPQNEEEILRDILALSNQLKYTKDLPQAVISFERQREDLLEFLVIIVRIVKPACCPIQDLFEIRPTFLHFIPDRIKVVGLIRKYRKEANVFRLQVKKEAYLRHDNSVDLYKARSDIAEELSRIIGEFRDYNGGTISKEKELFSKVSHLIGQKGKESPFVLENFFYSIEPAIMRSVLPAEPLKTLFFMILDVNEEVSEAIEIRKDEDKDFSYIVLLSKDPHFRSEVLAAIERTEIDKSHIATCFLAYNGLFYMGVLTRITAAESNLKLLFAIEEAVTVGI